MSADFSVNGLSYSAGIPSFTITESALARANARIAIVPDNAKNPIVLVDNTISTQANLACCAGSVGVTWRQGSEPALPHFNG